MNDSLTNKEVKVKRDAFVNSVLLVKGIFLEENISLTFLNYNKTIKEYLDSNEYDILTLQYLIIDLNLWFEYFSNLEALSLNLLLKKQNIKLYIDSLPDTSKNIDKSKELSTQVVKLKFFLKQIKIQKKLFSNISYICLNSYNNSCANYLYRN